MIDKIYIPTLGRPNEQVTWDNLPEPLREKVCFVIHEREKDLYKYDADYLVLPDSLDRISKVRKEIVYDADETRFCMWDDDVIFYRRNRKYYGDLRINGVYVPDVLKEDNKPLSKWKMKNRDFVEMFAQFNEWFDNEENLIHIGHRRTNLPPMGSTQDNVFFNSMHCIDGKKLKTIRDDIDWDLCLVGEDANFMLEYLTRGYTNRRTDLYSAHWGSYQEGGCSEYRDSKLHNQEHEKLMKRWPEYVSIRKEMMAQGKDGKNIGIIKEFKYNMKKAYKDSQTMEKFK
tara:strand:+ start:758 stop:1615 length:858 start_codon:yes stop_codon:yes gene_type:complete